MMAMHDVLLLPPAAVRPLAAVALVLVYAGFCGWTWWCYRQRQRPAAGAAGGVLVAYASQTGFAEMLAERTVAALQGAGRAAWAAPLGSLDAAALATVGQILFIVSTTGEGDPPDNAARFVSRVMAGRAALAGVRYGVLALGDRSYRHYCAFGHALDGWLRHGGALPLFDLVEVDNGDGAALRHWQGQLAHLAGGVVAVDWVPVAYQPWQLAARHHLNPGSPGGPVHHLWLSPPAGVVADWQAGDVAEVGPGNDPAQVAALLAALGLPAEMADDLRFARLPDQAGVWQGLSPGEIRQRLEPLPHREYSIASIPADGALELVVRQVVGPDGRLGLGSGWLTHHAVPGGPIRLRLRRNSAFHPPADDRPLILIGNGTGIAGLRAQLKARAAMGRGRNWLLFGERTHTHDSLFSDELAAWQAAGHLSRVDLAFSRDADGGGYVQDRLAAASGELRAWVADGAAIYVCGSLDGMAGGVHGVLEQELGADTLADMAADRRYCRDVY
jgi:sulfite reductase (NADPH) flavoprotein alpha-component